MSHWMKIRPTINEMVNQQFDTTEFKKLFAVTLTPRRIKVYQNHMTFYANNRRDCWAFVAGKAPLAETLAATSELADAACAAALAFAEKALRKIHGTPRDEAGKPVSARIAFQPGPAGRTSA